ncbi:MAG: hypothetical protein SGI92_03145 [Bryobacteraceae bacterium]|nr:hypothetical protein [Bryobacteraceae bacterium]
MTDSLHGAEKLLQTGGGQVRSTGAGLLILSWQIVRGRRERFTN